MPTHLAPGKVVDVASMMELEEFHMHRWMFVQDTVHANEREEPEGPAETAETAETASLCPELPAPAAPAEKVDAAPNVCQPSSKRRLTIETATVSRGPIQAKQPWGSSVQACLDTMNGAGKHFAQLSGARAPALASGT